MLNRTFLKYYWHKTYWVWLLLIIAFNFLYLPMSEGVANHVRSIEFIKHFELLPVVIILALLSITLFLDDRYADSGDLMYSLPISRRSLFFTKWLLGVFGIGISYVFLLLRFRQLYSRYGHLMNISFGVVLQFMVALALASVLIFTLLLFVQALLGNSLIAGAIGSVLILGYPIVTTLVTNLIWYNTGLPYDHPFIAWLMRVKYFRLNDLFTPDLLSSETGQTMYAYQNWGVKIIVLVLGIGLIYWLGHLAYTRGKAEYRGEFLIFPSHKPIFMWVMALGIGLAWAFWVAKPGLGHNVLQLNLQFIIGTIVGYFILKDALRLAWRA